MNRRNLQHGMSETLTYYAWKNMKRKRGGVCLSWRKFTSFIADLGPKPSPKHWLFRSKPYQRSRPGNVEWRTYKRSFQNIWQHLTPDEVLACQQHIETLCRRGGYDFDAGMNEFYLQDLANTENPVGRIHSWIKRYLPRILANLKKQRGEIQYNDKVNHDKSLQRLNTWTFEG